MARREGRARGAHLRALRVHVAGHTASEVNAEAVRRDSGQRPQALVAVVRVCTEVAPPSGCLWTCRAPELPHGHALLRGRGAFHGSVEVARPLRPQCAAAQLVPGGAPGPAGVSHSRVVPPGLASGLRLFNALYQPLLNLDS